MRVIAIFDTRVAGSNLGDHIIMESIEGILREMFRGDFFVRVQTQDRISFPSYKMVNQCELRFVGGTNLLSSNMHAFNQWKVNLWDSLFIGDAILMGVGWWQYQGSPGLYTKALLRRLLTSKHRHSVRDSYTARQLAAIGFTNVINTSCPTMWGLTRDHCGGIPSDKSDAAVVTLTEYNQVRRYDEELVRLVLKSYDKVYFWTQQPGDHEYMRSIAGDGVEYLAPTVASLDSLLASTRVDYIGTRLHAGVRALQRKRRTLVLAVDNRAIEISADTNLPTVDRRDLRGIGKWLLSSAPTEIRLPESEIERWKAQFA